MATGLFASSLASKGCASRLRLDTISTAAIIGTLPESDSLNPRVAGMDQNGRIAGRRPPRPAALAIASVALCLSVGAPPALGAQARDGRTERNVPTISGMRAHLFENETGQLSDDILGRTPSRLWNTIAGPHSANATLVVVEVSGPPSGTFNGFFGPQTKYLVRVVAREGARKLLLDRAQVIPVLSEQGKVNVAFLVQQSGCVPVRLTATIVGQRPGKPVERSLNFACGE